MTNLMQQCLSLPKEERERLSYMLNESLKEKKNANRRFKELLEVATSLLGFGIDSKCRDSSCVIGRMLIIYKMRQEGFSSTQIGLMLGRSHATILHFEKKMEDVFVYPEIFKIEIAYWNMFIKMLEEYGIN